jgi:hypothetical protein
VAFDTKQLRIRKEHLKCQALEVFFYQTNVSKDLVKGSKRTPTLGGVNTDLKGVCGSVQIAGSTVRAKISPINITGFGTGRFGTVGIILATRYNAKSQAQKACQENQKLFHVFISFTDFCVYCTTWVEYCQEIFQKR